LLVNNILILDQRVRQRLLSIKLWQECENTFRVSLLEVLLGGIVFYVATIVLDIEAKCLVDLLSRVRILEKNVT
jgi:hypothetical protein